MNKILILTLVLMYGCTTQISENGNDLELMIEVDEKTSDMQDTMDGDVVTFMLEAMDFKYTLDTEEAPELRVKVGDTVRIELDVKEGFHDWVVDEFNAATDQVRAGSIVTVEFVADKKGTFEYYCSVGSHRELGMIGKLIVE